MADKKQNKTKTMFRMQAELRIFGMAANKE